MLTKSQGTSPALDLVFTLSMYCYYLNNHHINFDMFLLSLYRTEVNRSEVLGFSHTGQLTTKFIDFKFMGIGKAGWLQASEGILLQGGQKWIILNFIKAINSDSLKTSEITLISIILNQYPVVILSALGIIYQPQAENKWFPYWWGIYSKPLFPV